MSFDVQEWYKKLQEDNSILAFKGKITPELITQILDKVEGKLYDIEEDPKRKKKLYNILVESLQNLFHHVCSLNEIKENFGENFAIFSLNHNQENYYISTGNFITNDKVQFLKDRLEQINHLSAEELKELYKLILNNEEFSDKGGGGLGMIDIARKSGNKLAYKFHKFDNNCFFYCLQVKVE